MAEAPKRRWKRVKVDVRVRIRRWEDPDSSATVVRTYEMSEGGMSVYASETLELGTVLHVEMSLPGGVEQLKLRAVVRNRRGFRCGLEYVDPTVAAKHEIARYLKALADVIEI